VECAEGEPLLNLDSERALCAEFMQTGVCRFRNHCSSFHPNWPLPVQFGVSAGELPNLAEEILHLNG
jgi:hypothetical protein